MRKHSSNYTGTKQPVNLNLLGTTLKPLPASVLQTFESFSNEANRVGNTLPKGLVNTLPKTNVPLPVNTLPKPNVALPVNTLPKTNVPLPVNTLLSVPKPNVVLPPIPKTTVTELITLPDIPQTTTVPRTMIPNTNNIELTQYTRELQLAPLSPKSPRVVIKSDPVVLTHPTNLNQTVTQDCCVCYDEKIHSHQQLECKHPICSVCINQLRAPECPMCKQYLKGPLVTDAALVQIMNRQEQCRADELTANYLAGLYLQEHPEANPEEVYARYRNE